MNSKVPSPDSPMEAHIPAAPSRSQLLRASKGELLLWWVVAAALTIGEYPCYFFGTRGISESFLQYITSSLIGHLLFHPTGSLTLALVASPLLFRYIFEFTPAVYIWWRRMLARLPAGTPLEEPTIRDLGPDNSGAAAQAGSENSRVGEQDFEAKPEYLIRRFQHIINTSSVVKEAAITRANLQLFSGATIGLLGLVFFFAIANTSSDIEIPEGAGGWDKALWQLILMIPRLTILIFIELMAGFFLKQYRVAMEEYRYFEGIYRANESLLISYLIRLHHREVDPLLDLAEYIVKPGSFGVPVLKEGESTAILESQKFSTNEFKNLTEQIVGILARVAPAEQADTKEAAVVKKDRVGDG